MLKFLDASFFLQREGYSNGLCNYTVKKGLAEFPFPAGMSLTKLSPGRELFIQSQAQEGLVKTNQGIL